MDGSARKVCSRLLGLVCLLPIYWAIDSADVSRRGLKTCVVVCGGRLCVNGTAFRPINSAFWPINGTKSAQGPFNRTTCPNAACKQNTKGLFCPIFIWQPSTHLFSAAEPTTRHTHLLPSFCCLPTAYSLHPSPRPPTIILSSAAQSSIHNDRLRSRAFETTAEWWVQYL